LFVVNKVKESHTSYNIHVHNFFSSQVKWNNFILQLHVRIKFYGGNLVFVVTVLGKIMLLLFVACVLGGRVRKASSITASKAGYGYGRACASAE